MKMGVNIDSVINDLQFDQDFFNSFKTYSKYINFRIDCVIRKSVTHFPPELHRNHDYSAIDPHQAFLFNCINGNNNKNIIHINKLRNELKTLTSEVSLKKKDINILDINEEGLRKNIKHLEEIISIKENYIRETANYTDIRCNAKEKVQKEYLRVNKKYSKILNQLNKTNKSIKINSSNGTSKHSDYSDRLNDRLLRYEAKIKKMDDIIKIAGESEEKLLQYKIALQTSKDRLQIFYDQLNSILRNKRELASFLEDSKKKIYQLKKNLSNLEVLSSNEKSRAHTSSIEHNGLKKDFLELQSMRNEVLSFRPRGMFNPKYQKENSLTNEEVRRYLENDEAIDSIDYLIEIKNNDLCKNDINLLKYLRETSHERTIFLKCLSTLNVNEIKKLLIHYFNKVVDLKESGRESDELIAKLDELNDKQRRNIVSINNNFQEFHLSIEKKFISLKKYYQDKVNKLFQLLQEENNAIIVFKMRQEINALKKKINELEKSQSVKHKDASMPGPHISQDPVDASKSGSETVSSAKVTCLKNKLKIQKNKSKLI